MIGVAPALRCTDLTVAFDGVTVLSEISFSVAVGSTVAVIGPSGSGKSTLLRAIAGLESPVAGSVELDGVDQRGVPPNERQLGMMFQDHALFPHLDVAGNVGFGLRMAKLDRDAAAHRVAEVLDMVGLGGFGARDVQTLSGGEAQRVALARALAPAPRLLMLDEPFGSLDRALRAGLVSELRALFAELGVTVLHVTHDQQEAFDLAAEVIVLRSGQLVQQGPPSELWHRPSDAFVADFLGHPNVWNVDGEVDGEKVLAPLPALRLAERETGLTDVDLVDADFVDADFVDAVVSDCSFREGRWRISADEVAGERRRLVLDGDVELTPGQPIRIAIDRNRLHRLA